MSLRAALQAHRRLLPVSFEAPLAREHSGALCSCPGCSDCDSSGAGPSGPPLPLAHALSSGAGARAPGRGQEALSRWRPGPAASASHPRSLTAGS